MPASERSEPSFRRSLRLILPGLGVLGALALLPGAWTTALSQNQGTVPGVPQDVQGAPTVTFTYAPGCLIVVDLPNDLLEGVPQGQQIRVIFNPAPVPPNQAAAGSLGGGNVIPLAPPIDLSLMVRDLGTGVETPLPPELTQPLVTLWFCHQLGRQHPDVRNCRVGRADPAPASRTGGPIRIESLGTVTAAAGGDDMP